MGEIKTNDLQEVKSPNADGFTNIKPETGMTVKKARDIVEQDFTGSAKDVGDSGEVNEKNEPEYLTTREERIDHAKHSKGEWEGEIGNSMFYPEDQAARDILDSKGVKGIEYKDGFADFSPVAVETVQIDGMTEIRPKNFAKAYEKLAQKFNQEERDGKSDWKAEDVKQWKADNNLSCHEKEDRKTVEFVPTSVHDKCEHYGGVAECKRMKEQNSASSGNYGGVFDV